MARLNEILVGRFNRGYQKLFGIKGGPPVATLAPEIMPSHVVFSGREERYAQGWDTFWAAIQVGAVAAQSSGVRFRNPPNSNFLATFEKINFWTSVADPQGTMIRSGPLTTDLTTIVTLPSARMDARGRQNPSVVISDQNAPVVAGQNPAIVPLAANSSFDYIWTDIQEVVLLPGDRIDVITQVVNANLTVNVIWRERFLEEPERT